MATYGTTFILRRPWPIPAGSRIVLFAAPLQCGRDIYPQAPPNPEHAETAASVRGHGGHLAPGRSTAR